MHGNNRIGYTLSAKNDETMEAINPVTGEVLLGKFHIATDIEINDVMYKAQEAFDTYRRFSGVRKAEFLEAIADEILALGDTLVRRACLETALPEGRIIGERGRTMNQLKLFAQVLREGSWTDAVIDTAQPDREPLPKPDIRKMSTPVGPVVVFSASNFPLAFSTAGGDTASALAAGNPVIMKAHPSHLGTNELVVDAIAAAAKKTGMPDGVFSSVQGNGFTIGQQLVKHSVTKSVAFTGSYAGGRALYDVAGQREEPIPVFAEMGSINPVLILPNKMDNESKELASTYAGSITVGTGQFCTNPGLLITVESEKTAAFIEELGKNIAATNPSTMLNAGIANNYESVKATALDQEGVEVLGQSNGEGSINSGCPAVAIVSAKDFINKSTLQHEVFGPYSLVVRCANNAELDQVIAELKGQLTATVMGSDEDVKEYSNQIHQLSNVVGRLIFNGVPTGVEVTAAMQHGGPFPASTDGRFTSVGTDAIKRFVRPLAYQSAPQEFLPDELKDANPLGIWRKVDGELTNKQPLE
jgi:NADP-dependent aldehyde dehydrogenase